MSYFKHPITWKKKICNKKKESQSAKFNLHTDNSSFNIRKNEETWTDHFTDIETLSNSSFLESNFVQSAISVSRIDSRDTLFFLDATITTLKRAMHLAERVTLELIAR